MGKRTQPEVFIIESLDLEDERENRFEGRLISNILGLSRKECEYFYIRTRVELEKLMQEFADSGYRYLHLSAHGVDGVGMATTFDRLSYAELGGILRPHLAGKRVFLSACGMARRSLAKELMGEGCFSVMGPSSTVAFSDAALLWASFYHLMFRTDPSKMKREWLLSHARDTARLFNVPLNVYVEDKTAKSGIKLHRVAPRPAD